MKGRSEVSRNYDHSEGHEERPSNMQPFVCADGHRNKKRYPLSELPEGISADTHHMIPSDPIVLGRQKMKQR